MFSSKSYFVERIITTLGADRPVRILDMGSGTSQNFVRLLTDNPQVTYIGVEPNPQSVEKARRLLQMCPNATVYNQLGYAAVPNESVESFDFVFSLSALEHIKHLDTFITASVRYAKQGGYIIHRYDLGHALFPSSLKEKVQVWMGTHAPWLLSERNFVSYLAESTVRDLLVHAGVSKIFKTTYHQMQSHKLFEKIASSPEFDRYKHTLYEWEFDVSEQILNLAPHDRERLFPSIAIWSQK